MSTLLKINNYFAALFDALKALFYFRLWTPFFIFALVSAAIAYMVLHPFSAPWSGLILAIGKSGLFAGGEAFAHYPTHILLAPSVSARIGIIFSILLDSLLSGAAFLMFAAFFAGSKTRFGEALRAAAGKYLWLVLANFILYLVFFLFSRFVPELFTDFLEGSPRRQMIFAIALNLALFLVISPLIYMIPYIVLRGEKLGGALLKSLRTWFKNFFTTFFTIVITQLLVMPFSIALLFGVRLSRLFSYDLIVWLMYGEIIAFMIASFLMTAMLTRIFTEYHE